MKRSLAKIEIDTWLIVTRLYLRIAGAFMNYRVLKRAQEELLDQIIDAEDYIRRLRGKRREINEERKGLLKRKGLDGKSKKRLKRLEQMQKLNREKGGLLYERLTLLRRLGDAIAWYAYGFNRHAVLELYRSDRKPASITGRTTLNMERRVIDAINNKGDDYFALMHDLTHCLSTADLTIFYPQGYQVIELKIHRGTKRAIRRDDRTKRQEALLKQIQEYEITGESEELVPGFLAKRLKSQVPDKYEWKRMGKLLKRAMLEGYALESVEGIVVYVAYEPELYEEVLNEVVSLIHEEGQTFTFRSLDRHQHANTAHLLPLFAFDIHPLLILDLVAGNLVLMTIANIDRLVAKLRESGARVAMTPTEEEREMAISPGFVDRLLLEGLSLDTFVGQSVEVQRLADELQDSQ
jgi:hypothetical protein